MIMAWFDIVYAVTYPLASTSLRAAVFIIFFRASPLSHVIASGDSCDWDTWADRASSTDVKERGVVGRYTRRAGGNIQWEAAYREAVDGETGRLLTFSPFATSLQTAKRVEVASCLFRKPSILYTFYTEHKPVYWYLEFIRYK